MCDAVADFDGDFAVGVYLHDGNGIERNLGGVNGAGKCEEQALVRRLEQNGRSGAPAIDFLRQMRKYQLPLLWGKGTLEAKQRVGVRGCCKG